MRILTNEQIEQILSMPECVDTLEAAYRDLGLQDASDLPRQDLLVPVQREGAVHAFKTMSGSWPQGGITALRLNSDIVTWPVIDGTPHRVKVPAAPGDRWVGLVMLFDVQTGTPLTIFPDGVMQKTRVGGASGVAMKYLSRPDSRRVGLLGSGWQAGAQLDAVCAVRPVESIKVFSPHADHCADLVDRYSRRLGISVEAVHDAESAARDVDILISATNSLVPTIRPEWIQPGMHVTSVRGSEIPESVLALADRLVVNTLAPVAAFPARGWPSEVPEFVNGDYRRPDQATFDWSKAVELATVVAGRSKGRESTDEITCFHNYKGMGLQFAALGSLVWKQAEAQNLGVQLPTEYFTETVHP